MNARSPGLDARPLARLAEKITPRVVVLGPFVGLALVILIVGILDSLAIAPLRIALGDLYERAVTSPAAELRDRLAWAAVMLAYFLIAVGTIALASAAAARRLSSSASRSFSLLYAALPIILVSGAFVYLVLKGSPLGRPSVLHPLLERTVYTGAVKELTIVQEWFTAAVILSVAWACGLAARGDSATGSVEERVLDLGADIAEARQLLFFSAGVLVTGVLCVFTLFAWAEGMTVTWDVPGVGSPSVAPAMAGAAGTFYTGILAGIFGPTYFALRRRARALARLHHEKVEPEHRFRSEEEVVKWMQDRAIVPTMPKRAMSLFAIAAPVLAGPAATLFGLLGRGL